MKSDRVGGVYETLGNAYCHTKCGVLQTKNP
jgi:hypothetical protein